MVLTVFWTGGDELVAWRVRPLAPDDAAAGERQENKD